MTGTILIIATGLFLMLNISSSVFFKALRLDLTQNKIYTLSSGSKQILGQLREPVILRFYYSKKLSKVNPYLTNFASRIQDLLIQYERNAKGKIVLEVIDPEPFSVEEDTAVNYGLRGIPVDNTGSELYLGLVATNSVNLKKVIPFFQPNREQNLEYDVSQMLYNISNPEARLVGVMSALPMQGKDSRPWAVWQQMAQLFELESLDINTKEIPDKLNTLMIVEPKHFTNDALKAIDKFISRGGHLIAFVDPYSEVIDQKTAQALAQTKDSSAKFSELLQSWGLELEPGKVVTDKSMAKPVTVRQDGREANILYPFWFDCTAKNFDKKDILTSSLEKITLATPGSLVKIPGSETSFSPLITTSSEAMLVEALKIPEYQQQFANFMSSHKATGAYVVAARVSGPIKSPYSGIITANSNIIVVADADMLHDHFWLSIQNSMGKEIGVQTASNGNFVLSALDNLSGSDSLISIRNRGTFVRPFETIKELESKSQSKYRESEVDLLQKLELTKRKLEQLEKQKKDGNSMQLSAQQRKEDDAFRGELVNTRRELREVRRKLNKDIEVVETSIKFFSIGFIPLMIVFGCLVAWGLQVRRELRSRAV